MMKAGRESTLLVFSSECAVLCCAALQHSLSTEITYRSTALSHAERCIDLEEKEVMKSFQISPKFTKV